MDRGLVMVAVEDEVLWPILRVDLDQDRNEARKSRDRWRVGGESNEKREHTSLGDLGEDGEGAVPVMLVSEKIGEAGVAVLFTSVSPILAPFGFGAFLGA